MSDARKKPSQEFTTTQWSLIGQAMADGTTVRAAAIEELVLRYRPPLRAHLILRKRLDEERADEILQGFITDKILQQYLLRHADREKGRFRSLLVRSLGNYLTDWLRAQALQAQAGMNVVLEEAQADSDSVSQAFDIAWARQMLEEVLATMRADCEAGEQLSIWGVFECRLLAPAFEQTEPISYEEICRRFGFASPEQASNALITAKRKFQRAFERVAARYQHDEEKADDILRELIGILSQAGPLEWRQAAAAGVVNRHNKCDSIGDLDDSEPARMARMLDLPSDADELWFRADLHSIMRHQLAQRLTDLELDVSAAFPSFTHSASAVQLVTLADLFQHPQPPLALLVATKIYGRNRVRRNNYPLPGEIASAIYFASIAAALVRHGERISSSDESLLRYGFARATEQPWIEGPLRQLFEQGLTQLA